MIKPNYILDEFPSTKKDVLNIKKILEGEINASYSFYLKIYEGLYKSPENNIFSENCNLKKFDLYNSIREALISYTDNGTIKQNDIELIKLCLNKNCNEVTTLIDMIEANLLGMMKETIEFDEGNIIFLKQPGLYTQTNKFDTVAETIKILNCIIGNSAMNIFVVFNKGTSNISICYL